METAAGPPVDAGRSGMRTAQEARGLLNLPRFAGTAEIEAAYQARLGELGPKARDKDRAQLAVARDLCISDLDKQRQLSEQREREVLQRHSPLSELEEPEVPGCTLLGGTGYLLRQGVTYDLHFLRTHIGVWASTNEGVDIDHTQLTSLEVYGPGRVESGGGFIGGGSGLAGFAAGAAVAAVLNAATSRTSVQTFLRLEFSSGELFFQVTVAEPTELRIILSPVFTRLRSAGQGPKLDQR